MTYGSVYLATANSGLGVPVAIPILYQFHLLSTTAFFLLQLGYYYVLLRLSLLFFGWKDRPRCSYETEVEGASGS